MNEILSIVAAKYGKRILMAGLMAGYSAHVRGVWNGVRWARVTQVETRTNENNEIVYILHDGLNRSYEVKSKL